MTSYPVDNKTLLSRKPCIADKSYYGTLLGYHGRSFRIRHEKVRAAPSLWRTNDDVLSLSRKPCIVEIKVAMPHSQELKS